MDSQESLANILDMFVQSDRSNALLIYLVVFLLHHKGVLSKSDLDTLTGALKEAENYMARPNQGLSHTPIAYFLECLMDKESTHLTDIKPILTLIEGGKQ